VTAPLETLTYPDVAALSRAAADMIAAAAQTAVEERGRFTLCLSGGSTPRTLYQLLAAEYRERVPWAATSVFFGDERCVPPDNPDSNYAMARAVLLSQISGLETRTHRIEGERAPADAAVRYEVVLRGEFDAPGDSFDILLLGIGTDGHTASLFPGSPALAERRHWVVATEAPPTAATRARVTLTYPLLNGADTTLILCAGADKRDILGKISAARADAPARYPVMQIAPRERLCWLLDRAAASPVGASP
jgi:6-phosphogluconolactonase